jgi:tetratricopeptide (TPR) repeat protein
MFKKENMRLTRIKSFFVAGAFILSTGVFAQKSNVVSAALEFKDAQEAMMKQDMETAATKISEAKRLIDEAKENEQTKNDPKALMYLGKINLGVLMIAAGSESESMAQYKTEEKSEALVDEAFEAFKKSKENDRKKKYVDDIDQSLNQMRFLSINTGVQFFQVDSLELAYASFNMASRAADALGVSDTLENFNAGLAAEKLGNFEVAAGHYQKCAEAGYRIPETYIFTSSAYRRAEQPEKALEVIKNAREKHPMNKDILIEMVNINLERGDNEAAQASLEDAIATDPDNKQLHYVVGTVYDNLKQYENAEKAYNKALEIDPKYFDAMYNLGALYFNKGVEIVQAANDVMDDEKYKQMQDEAKAEFEKAVPILEKCHEMQPDDRNTMMALMQLYPRIGETEKYTAIKAKLQN